jgi:preprotein translocase SecE subunit
VLVPFTGGRSIVLLTDLEFTLPLLVTLASLWLAYRIVNLPGFADFLIATEAEMNKVSWTTRHRLIQDTIVVLVTVVLLTTFLFVVDVVWNYALTRIGVIVEPKANQTANTTVHW